ncbi:MAG TPA: hypothetical protein VK610_05035 [Rhodothermales bacterium]|nr:hypothetical protein [Rhodothermales bacterium]
MADLPTPTPEAPGDDTMVVSKERLRSFLQDLDEARGERDRALGELDALRGEHEALQAQLTGSLSEIIRLRERLAARGGSGDPHNGVQD